jgi:hypothetical protein
MEPEAAAKKIAQLIYPYMEVSNSWEPVQYS